MVKSIKMTKRDVLLLKDIYDNCFLTFYQIHEVHFADRARPTVYNRLSKMSQANLIEAINVNLFAHHRKNESIGVIYRLTKKGIDVLSHFLQGEVLSGNIATLNFNSIYHDLLLTDVLRVIKRRLPLFKVLSSKSNMSGWNEKDRIPDAILFNPRANIKMALELELTAKSETRYREIILSYRTSNEFEKVFYIYKDESIQNKMGGLITGFKGQYTKGDYTDKFDFYILKDFLHNTSEDRINELQN